MKKIVKFGDIVVVLIVLLISAVIIFFSSVVSADYAVIYLNGVEYGRYQLSENVEKEIEVLSEGGYNIVKIKNNEVCVIDTSCKDKLEVFAGPIKKAGQSLVCLPNKVVVTIEGGVKTDATAF